MVTTFCQCHASSCHVSLLHQIYVEFFQMWIGKWDEYLPEDDKTHLQIQNVPVCGMYSQRKTECNVYHTNNLLKTHAYYSTLPILCILAFEPRGFAISRSSKYPKIMRASFWIAKIGWFFT